MMGATIQCTHCGNSVIVPEALRGQPSGPVSGRLDELMAQFPAHAAQLREMQASLERGHMINAIKIFRTVFGAGLKEAKDAVEALAAGRSVQIATVTQGQSVVSMQAAPPPETSDEVRRLILAGKKIDAIALYRRLHGTGLKESKEAVEALQASLPADEIAQARRAARASTPASRDQAGRPAAAWMMACLGFVLALGLVAALLVFVLASN